MPPPAEVTTTVTVDLTPFQMPGRVERLVAAQSADGNYVITCLPFFTYGIQFGDLVQVVEPERAFERVLARSGLRVLRVAFTEKEEAVESPESDQPEAGEEEPSSEADQASEE